jgi:hypothetical protein
MNKYKTIKSESKIKFKQKAIRSQSMHLFIYYAKHTRVCPVR